MENGIRELNCLFLFDWIYLWNGSFFFQYLKFIPLTDNDWLWMTKCICIWFTVLIHCLIYFDPWKSSTKGLSTNKACRRHQKASLCLLQNNNSKFSISNTHLIIKTFHNFAPLSLFPTNFLTVLLILRIREVTSMN